MKPLDQLHFVETVLRNGVEQLMKEIKQLERSKPTPIEHASLWMMKKGASQLEYAYLHVSSVEGRRKHYIGRNDARIAETRQAISKGKSLSLLKANLAKSTQAVASFEQIVLNASRQATSLARGLETGDPKQRALPFPDSNY